MEDNSKKTSEEFRQENTVEGNVEKRVTYTKQQSVLYTVISIALFFLIYFAVKGITGTVNQPYMVYAYAGDISEERVPEVFSISGIMPESGCVFENVRLEKGTDGYVFTALFHVADFTKPGVDSDWEASDWEISDLEENGSVADGIISFGFGDPEEDIRTGLYPYAENPNYAEYAYGEKYVDMEAPAREIIFFEWNGAFYAQYRQYGNFIPTEIKALFSGLEKVY